MILCETRGQKLTLLDYIYGRLMLIQPYLLKTKLVYEYPGSSWNISSGSTDNVIELSLSDKVGGPGQLPNTEEIFVNAIASHILEQFTLLAEKNKLQYEKVEINTEVILEPNKNGRPEIKKINLQFTIFHTSHREKAELLAQQAKKESSIFQAIKFEKLFSVIVVQ